MFFTTPNCFPSNDDSWLLCNTKTLPCPAYTMDQICILTVCTEHHISHFHAGKSRSHPSEKWILIHWKEMWSKAQTGNPLGQVGAFSGPLPLPLLPPLLCPPAALPGLPIKEQKSHLVFVWGQFAGRMYCVVLYVLSVSNHACIEFVHVSPARTIELILICEIH